MKYTITIEVDTHDDASQVEQLFSALAAVSAPTSARKSVDEKIADEFHAEYRDEFIAGFNHAAPVTEPGPSDNIGTLTVHSMTGADHAALVAPVEQAAPVEPIPYPEQVAARMESAPTAPVAPVEQPVNIDTNGLPWDARIHASTKTTNADGSWRNRRGVDKELIAQIEAELKSGAAPTTAAPVPFVDVVDEIAKTVDTIRSSFSADPFIVPTAPPFDLGSPVTAPVDAAPAAAPTMTYGEFMQNLSVVVQTKGLTTDHIKAMCAKIGVADVMSLGTQPELIPAAVAYLDTIKVK